MKQIKVKTKRMRQNMKNIMREEVEEILNTMDFTNSEIQVHYDEKTNTTRHLLEYGNSQLELICTPGLKIKPQTITIACNNSEYLKKRLLNKGIEVSEYSEDSYTGLRTYSIKGPDNVTITIIEE